MEDPYDYFLIPDDVVGKHLLKIKGAIRDKSLLVPGKSYIKVYTMVYTKYKSFIRHFRFVRHVDNKWFEEELEGMCNKTLNSYADCGIIPYENGMWNVVNYVIKDKE